MTDFNSRLGSRIKDEGGENKDINSWEKYFFMPLTIEDIIIMFLLALGGAGIWNNFVSPANTFWGSVIAIGIYLIYRSRVEIQ